MIIILLSKESQHSQQTLILGPHSYTLLVDIGHFHFIRFDL